MQNPHRIADALETFIRAVVADEAAGSDVHESIWLSEAKDALIRILEEM